MRRLLLAFQFLTILPVRVSGKVTEEELGGSSAFYPMVGLAQGLIFFGALLLLAKIFPPEIVAGFLIVLSTALNGGFHLDGLADTFDAVAVRSTGDRLKDLDRRLSAMKDSATGAIGVAAVVIVLLLKFVLFKNMLSFNSAITAFLLLLIMPVYSKWIMVPAMYHGSAARGEGLGRIFIESASMQSLIISSVSAFLVVMIIAAGLGASYGAKALMLFLPLLSGYLLALAMSQICFRLFGGLTGDTLGALSEISEIFYLTGAYIWLQHCI